MSMEIRNWLASATVLNGLGSTGCSHESSNDRSYGIFATGNGMEDYFQEIWKDQGILMAGNVVNYGAIDTHPDAVISGESDIIVWDHDIDAEGKITAIHRDRAIGIEMKTCRGHFAKKEIRNWQQNVSDGKSPDGTHHASGYVFDDA